ncbi:inovirus-type Gp2 protein [Acinetobacter bereziniae]|uniref:YagK/YfjJ domain-containing protein n=1 Tax=Acinetobacter bereziniae TaxID=106648 RepID=UPI00157FC38D|nr:inovirus-type Gp2 protein [Acinetobacter bereziniae]NUF65562.1 inovirus-type Gp2 protein [Acinetobacter bereziniae]NUG09762.1 inovirus-type Gp2 protein [Acinetobacter bereziniae]NUG66129.1 inovirus-type Gp2 protein [Acinetobacter bereziniae]NUG71926.1 inovirus-type Gp2 protein [Acinetobacter bereziniae]NUG82322.1 inovirus-type Gp2 protein [Acinetobacter bereziniae]
MTEAQTLLAIENFMKQVIKPTYRWYNFDEDFQDLLHEADAIYNPKYQYTPLVQAYFDVLNDLVEYGDTTIFDDRQAFKRFQNQVKEAQEAFIQSFQRNNQRNRNNLQVYFNGLVDRHRKLLLVRVDLHYPSDVCKSMKQFSKDIKKLIKRVQDKDTIFKDQIGYAYRLEQGGKSRGYHCHLLVIYDGSKHCKDSYLSGEIGLLWREIITSGHGEFFSCNTATYKREYRLIGTLGIGMIERKDKWAVANALTAISYLARPDKDNQYLRAKLTGMREFGKGQLNDRGFH